ncbi:hypothetical protein [Rubrivivax gelatinosus]|uniref:hypothetical protein n=1 Tax=Rubrivivax gelatinosus TaxID=28068 RepID=UPI001907013A|nr:hypothetical protein [Rubrivivax gelatinosus]
MGELANADAAIIREHIRARAEIKAKYAQADHEQTQTTDMAGDAAEDVFVRRTRPAQAWLSQAAASA